MNYFSEIINNDDIIYELPKINLELGYELDNWQKISIIKLLEKENVLITAPTGSGKTLPIEFKISEYTNNKKKLIYISPIKSLSNQKYHEFSKFIKNHNIDITIGIMTGDIKLNPTADLIIMTAEIFRNAIITKNITTSNWIYNPYEIDCVILDEVHFINNNDRGTVWEEILINLDPKIQLLMLSATITGAEQLGTWIGNLKQVKCNLIKHNKRPVPLSHYIFIPQTMQNQNNLFLESELMCFLEDKTWNEGVFNKASNIINKYYEKHENTNAPFFQLIDYLFEKELTPANIFLLDKKKIEQYAKNIKGNFTTYEETIKIKNEWKNYLHKHVEKYEKTTEWNNLYSLVIKGIGYHHAGMIPMLKEIVEILYSQGLIKFLLATETLAMGVNMPTKVSVFCNIYKKDNTSKRLFRSDEYIQMAGRAGRRGKDTIGKVIILPIIKFIKEHEAKNMITSNPQTIISKLSIDSVFVLKQILNLSHIKCINLINSITLVCKNSLLNYQQDINNFLIQRDYEFINDEIEKIQKNNQLDINQYNIYEKLLKINEDLKPDGFIKPSSKKIKELLKEKKIIII